MGSAYSMSQLAIPHPDHTAGVKRDDCGRGWRELDVGYLPIMPRESNSRRRHLWEFPHLDSSVVAADDEPVAAHVDVERRQGDARLADVDAVGLAIPGFQLSNTPPVSLDFPPTMMVLDSGSIASDVTSTSSGIGRRLSRPVSSAVTTRSSPAATKASSRIATRIDVPPGVASVKVRPELVSTAIARPASARAAVRPSSETSIRLTADPRSRETGCAVLPSRTYSCLVAPARNTRPSSPASPTMSLVAETVRTSGVLESSCQRETKPSSPVAANQPVLRSNARSRTGSSWALNSSSTRPAPSTSRMIPSVHPVRTSPSSAGSIVRTGSVPR